MRTRRIGQIQEHWGEVVWLFQWIHKKMISSGQFGKVRVFIAVIIELSGQEQRSCAVTADATEQAQSGKMVCGHLFLESPDKDSPNAKSLLSCMKTS